LAALAAGGAELRARGHGGPALVLAVDLPGVDETLLRWLRDRPGEATVVPELAGRRQLVCARYGADALLAAQSLVMGGVRALHELLDVVPYEVVDEVLWGDVAASDAFLDVDTPGDAAQWGIEVPGLA
jgi:molybdopterin-guanine dinucleotide biosynthesis protein A